MASKIFYIIVAELNIGEISQRQISEEGQNALSIRTEDRNSSLVSATWKCVCPDGKNWVLI